jgi:endonuclease IV
MKEKLKDRVFNVATNWQSSYNLKQNADKKLHYTICKRLNEISKEKKFPMSVLVYIAIGTNAHRSQVFDMGYKKFDEKKALTIIKWCELFAKHFNNPSLRTNDNVVHALAKIYDKYSNKSTHFKSLLNKLDKTKLDFNNTKKLYNLLVL